MPILVDYRCGACGHREERWTPTPPPAAVPCGRCGGQSSRAWAAIGLSGRSRSPEPGPGRPTAGPRRSMCSRYPQVPGLCHMSESAGRMWVAKYLGDQRAVDRESQRQEEQATSRPPVMADAITHHHHDARPSVDPPAVRTSS